MQRVRFAYNRLAIIDELIGAKSAAMALTGIPYQRSWADELQKVQLKREVAGTSRIEGAEFTERELEAAMRETAQQLEIRSQRQAAAAVRTYRWIAVQPADLPVNIDLVTGIHRRMVTGCDEDHCPLGKMRERYQNVTFGAPRHRGCEGSEQCTEAMRQLTGAVQMAFRGHDPLIQALAMHDHCAAIHPFLDGKMTGLPGRWKRRCYCASASAIRCSSPCRIILRASGRLLNRASCDRGVRTRVEGIPEVLAAGH